jgi:hypothetical protein
MFVSLSQERLTYNVETNEKRYTSTTVSSLRKKQIALLSRRCLITEHLKKKYAQSKSKMARQRTSPSCSEIS